MRVVLINPPHPYLIKPDSQAPLGLMYLAAVLRNAGHEVEIVNLSRYDEGDAFGRIPLDADLYGFTATSLDYGVSERLALRLRAEGVTTILGGPHATVAPELVNAEAFNAISIGEGEDVILDIARDAESKALQPRYVGKRILDLDRLPLPARDLMDVIGGDVFAGGAHYAGKLSTVIIGSRGCPYDCAFCASRPVWGGRVVFRSVSAIADEIRRVRDGVGIREFRFSDDTLNANATRLRALCDAIAPLDVYWRGSVRAGLSSKDDFQRMYDSGCRELSPGIESGDQRVLDVLCKGTTVEENRQMVNDATAAGINVRVLLMCGTPGEHDDTPERNRAFLATVDFHLVSLTQFRPLPGSAIWIEPRRFGCRIIDRQMGRDGFCFWKRAKGGGREPTPIRSVIETDELSATALEANVERMRQYALETGKLNMG